MGFLSCVEFELLCTCRADILVRLLLHFLVRGLESLSQLLLQSLWIHERLLRQSNWRVQYWYLLHSLGHESARKLEVGTTVNWDGKLLLVEAGMSFGIGTDNCSKVELSFVSDFQGFV